MILAAIVVCAAVVGVVAAVVHSRSDTHHYHLYGTLAIIGVDLDNIKAAAPNGTVDACRSSPGDSADVRDTIGESPAGMQASILKAMDDFDSALADCVRGATSAALAHFPDIRTTIETAMAAIDRRDQQAPLTADRDSPRRRAIGKYA